MTVPIIPMTIPIQALRDTAILPRQGHASDAGYDLHTTDSETELSPGDRVMFGTGLAMAIPDGYVGFIKPRSGLAAKQGIDVLGGVVDSGYRGEIKVILLNTGRRPVTIRRWDRIAQLVIQRVPRVVFAPVSELPGTVRGEGGFGSTGA